MTTIFIIIIICFSYFVQSAFGFGAGLIAIPFLSLLIDAKDAVTIVMIFSSICGLLVIKLWKDVDWNSIRKLTPGLILGLFVGLALFSAIDRRLLGTILSMYIIFYVLNDTFKPKKITNITTKIPVKIQSLVSGLAGGVIQGIMGTGGPMLVTYLKAHTQTINQFRATVIGIFFIANLLRFAFMGSEDLISPQIIKYTIMTIPFFLISMYLGYHFPNRFNKKTFNQTINILLLISALSIMIKQLA